MACEGEEGGKEREGRQINPQLQIGRWGVEGGKKFIKESVINGRSISVPLGKITKKMVA